MTPEQLRKVAARTAPGNPVPQDPTVLYAEVLTLRQDVQALLRALKGKDQMLRSAQQALRAAEEIYEEERNRRMRAEQATP